jgi:capsular polysaccharide transport system permease protein
MIENRKSDSFFEKLKSNAIWSMAVLFIAIMAVYWGGVATDRYASESIIVLESPQISTPNLDFQSLLSGGGSAGRSDMLLLRDYMLSVDMVKKLETEFSIREHYSSNKIDWFSRLRDDRKSLEELHRYFLKRVSVDFDEYSQLLRIRVQAFDAKTAFDISSFLIKEGEKHMNEMGQRLASEQVIFLEAQVKGLKERFNDSLASLIDFQNKSGLVSADGEIQSVGTLIAGMQERLATLTAELEAARSFQSSRSPEVVRLESEIRALKNEINEQRTNLAKQSGGALNVLASEYQLLEMSVQFARESYSSGLAALQTTRIEAARQLKQVSIIQNPSLPQFATDPERLHKLIVICLVTFLLTLILQMLVMIVRDHKD